MKTPLTENDWAKIISLYRSGEVEIAALAERFQLTYEGVRNGLKKRNALESSGQIKRKGCRDVGKTATAAL